MRPAHNYTYCVKITPLKGIWVHNVSVCDAFRKHIMDEIRQRGGACGIDAAIVEDILQSGKRRGRGGVIIKLFNYNKLHTLLSTPQKKNRSNTLVAKRGDGIHGAMCLQCLNARQWTQYRSDDQVLSNASSRDG